MTMKNPIRDFNEHRVRNDFLKVIEDQPGKVQIRMCVKALMLVLRRVEAQDAADALLELTELMAAIDQTEH
jgi:Holliday junction resolvasome RuvABC endonuclease subunit